MRRLKVGIAALLVVSVVAMAAKSVSASVVYDATAQFDPVNNPSAPWSYGGRDGADSTAFTPFTPYHNPVAPAGLKEWAADWPGGGYGVVTKNMTDTTIILGYYNNVVFPPGTMTMHPGPGTLGSVLRWTAPASGLCDIQATFTGSDTMGTTTDFHVVYNGSSLYSGYINGYLDSQSFLGSKNVNAGDVIDIFLGNGINGNEICDTTRVALTITSTVPEPATIPEPATVIVWSLLGGLGISVAEWRRRKRAA